MGTIKRIALVLLIIGGINWGLIGLFQFDLVASIFGGQDSGLARIVYSLVGLSSLICIPILFDRLGESDEATTNQRIRSDNVNYGVEFGEDIDDDFELSNRDSDRKQ